MTSTSRPVNGSGGGERRSYRIVHVVLLPALLVAWHLAAERNLASDRVLPAPGEVATALFELLRRGYFYENLWATMRVLGVGVFLAVAGGIGLAVVIGLVPILRDGVYPYIVGLNVVPKVALVPLLTVTLGYSYNSRIVVVFLVAFFPVFLNTLAALIDARADRDRLMSSLGASRVQRLRMHRLPEGASAIFAGIKLSITIAFIAAILAEFLIQKDGLAYLIAAARVALNAPNMYAVTIAVAVLGTLIYFAVEMLERRVVFWESPPSKGGRKR